MRIINYCKLGNISIITGSYDNLHTLPKSITMVFLLRYLPDLSVVFALLSIPFAFATLPFCSFRLDSAFCILHSGLYSVGVALARQSTDSLRHGLEPSTRVGSLVAQSTGSVECLDPRD